MSRFTLAPVPDDDIQFELHFLTSRNKMVSALKDIGIDSMPSSLELVYDNPDDHMYSKISIFSSKNIQATADLMEIFGRESKNRDLIMEDRKFLLQFLDPKFNPLILLDESKIRDPFEIVKIYDECHDLITGKTTHSIWIFNQPTYMNKILYTVKKYKILIAIFLICVLYQIFL